MNHRLAGATSLFDGKHGTSDDLRRQRRKGNSLLLALFVGFLIFSAAASGLYFVLRPGFSQAIRADDSNRTQRSHWNSFDGRELVMKIS